MVSLGGTALLCRPPRPFERDVAMAYRDRTKMDISKPETNANRPNGMILLALTVLATIGNTPQDAPSTPLPVSIARIRAALSAEPTLRQDPPLFRVDVVERIPDLLPPIDFNGGPVPPGGLYAYEQRQRLGSPTIGQPLITIDVLPLAHALARSIHTAVHEHVAQSAHEEVQRAIWEYCESRGAEAGEIAICRSTR